MAGDQVQDMHVAIIGLALAMGLHKKGVPFTVYEAAPEYSTVGAGIGFGPNGDMALEMIHEGFLAKYELVCVGHKAGVARDVYYEGLLLEEGLGLKEPWSGNSSFGHPNYIRRAAHRNAVLQIMTSFIPISKVHFSKRLTDIKQLPDKVILTFADGEVAEASVVVGADGIKSITREHVLKPMYPNEVEPVYSGSYCYRGVIPIAEGEEILGDLTNVAKMYFGNGRCCVTYLISGGTEFNFLLCASDTQPWEFKHTVTQKVSPETMLSDFEYRGIDDRFLQLLKKAQPIKWGLFHHRSTSTYYRGRVVLLGDSAHASLPFQAAGAGQGLEDALVLSNVLDRIFSGAEKDQPLEKYISAGFAGYDSVRRPRAQRQLERAHEMSLMLYFQHPETGTSMERVLEKLQNGWLDWLWFRELEADIQSAVQGVDQLINS
ncbi:hypothetical protein ASPCADRAFT_178793 [Aspergillus carbonarius ITEM 5010]|uniref:FAD-binding domain-containing protein n=1 Tax=Aspergillus carbonarius (strain ITEM 5010) TaxID=602072 RepID=A0A1R3R7Z7_ASPC5|nr:hypothetical protein ASPCADRAFT_178793 [Aspergillus carbonarius ITEM 5010]